jgi:hypothetical protein
MKGARMLLLIAGLAVVAGVSVVVHTLNDFARVQGVQVGNTPLERDTLSRFVFTNESPKKIAFQLRCPRPFGAMLSHSVVLAPYAAEEFDPNPELAGRELPQMIASQSCEAMWQGPLGLRCRAWKVGWTYNRPVRKGVILADEDGACRIATCYASGKLRAMGSCLSAVYLRRRES